MAAFSCRVIGDPAPQGSKRYVGNGRMVESSLGLKAWRETIVQYVALLRRRARFETKVNVALHFITKRDADVDKLARGVLDALTESGLILDDRLVIDLHATKRRSQDTGEDPGVEISVWEAGER
jgi:crossover junction endodeoxyribonuclease RusA